MFWFFSKNVKSERFVNMVLLFQALFSEAYAKEEFTILANTTSSVLKFAANWTSFVHFFKFFGKKYLKS